MEKLIYILMVNDHPIFAFEDEVEAQIECDIQNSGTSTGFYYHIKEVELKGKQQ